MSLIEYASEDAVAVVSLNRPDQANAQSPQMLIDLDAAYDRAVEDRAVRVIVLRANGRHFSAGHDISGSEASREGGVDLFGNVAENGMLDLYRWETQNYFGFCRKWRDLPKPTIAAVQGACIGGGLMLAWPCDLIVAADNAYFSDPVVRMGIGGVEYHGHTWELGPRRAKELLFTAGRIDAQEAQRIGMVNRVVPLTELDAATLALAREISTMHPHALLMAKQAVNQTLDAMGQPAALQAAFTLHSLGHANAWAATNHPVIARLDEMVAGNRPSPRG